MRHNHDGSDLPHTHPDGTPGHDGGPHGFMHGPPGTDGYALGAVYDYELEPRPNGPGPLACPHCESADVDRGATGLDMCNECGGLSRNGEPLERHAAPFSLVVMRGDPPDPGQIQQFVNQLSAHLESQVLVVHLPPGVTIETLDDDAMAVWGWVRKPDTLEGDNAVPEIKENEDGRIATPDQPG